MTEANVLKRYIGRAGFILYEVTGDEEINDQAYRDIQGFVIGLGVGELEREFQASMDYYLAMCTERGEEPDKPFSGKVHLRMPPKIHRAASTSAQAEGKSINAWLVETIERAVH